jgi:biotin operon repressor
MIQLEKEFKSKLILSNMATELETKTLKQLKLMLKFLQVITLKQLKMLLCNAESSLSMKLINQEFAWQEKILWKQLEDIRESGIEIKINILSNLLMKKNSALWERSLRFLLGLLLKINLSSLVEPNKKEVWFHWQEIASLMLKLFRKPTFLYAWDQDVM